MAYWKIVKKSKHNVVKKTNIMVRVVHFYRRVGSNSTKKHFKSKTQRSFKTKFKILMQFILFRQPPTIAFYTSLVKSIGTRSINTTYLES
jgi:hypothetical protein